MKLNPGKATIFSFILLFSLNANSQFSLKSEFRIKNEYRNGIKVLPADNSRAAIITAQRSRLILFNKTEKLSSKLTIQDVRIWGAEIYKQDNASIDVYEAWSEIHFNQDISLKIGRQMLKYDKQRLLGLRNWNDVGASHDLALFKYQNEKSKMHFGIAYNNDKSKNYESNYPLNYYKAMLFLWYSYQINNILNFSLMDLADGNQKNNSDTKIYLRNTLGGNFWNNPDSYKLSFYTSFYYQMGTDKQGLDLSSYFYSIKINYTLSDNLTILAAIDYGSGDDASDTLTNNAFCKLYGNGHGYYGYMDYFTEMEQHTYNGGLTDIYLRANTSFPKNLSAELTYHYFSLNADDLIDKQSNYIMLESKDKYLGSEIDFTLSYNMTKNINFMFGYSMMFASNSMELIKEGNSNKLANWAWLMITLKPTFISD